MYYVYFHVLACPPCDFAHCAAFEFRGTPFVSLEAPAKFKSCAHRKGSDLKFYLAGVGFLVAAIICASSYYGILIEKIYY